MGHLYVNPIFVVLEASADSVSEIRVRIGKHQWRFLPIVIKNKEIGMVIQQYAQCTYVPTQVFIQTLETTKGAMSFACISYQKYFGTKKNIGLQMN